MRVIGIDQSFQKCAFVFLENGAMTGFGVISTSKNDDVYRRAWTIAQELMKFCLDRRVDRFSIEGLAFGMRGNATRDLAGLQFVLLCALRFISGIDEFDVWSPTTIKKFASGSGKADKQLMIDSLPDDVRKTFESRGFKPKKGLDDLADAYFLASYSSKDVTGSIE